MIPITCGRALRDAIDFARYLKGWPSVADLSDNEYETDECWCGHIQLHHYQRSGKYQRDGCRCKQFVARRDPKDDHGDRK